MAPQAQARRMVAIGGGGFLMYDARWLQERWIVSLLRPAAGRVPRALFLGTAGGDSDRAQLAFVKCFTALGCQADTLTFFPYDMKRDYAQAVLDADLVYVGGGNTVAMVAVWRTFGFDAGLRRAYDGGTLLAGISAGANCWFDRYVTDSVPGGGVRDGLGFVPGTFCPHFDSEAWRQSLVERLEAPAYAAGEHVAMLFEDGRFVDAVASKPAHDPSAAMARVRVGNDPWREVAARSLAATTEG